MIYKVVPWEDKLYSVYIETNATEEQFLEVIKEVKEIEGYQEHHIFEVLESKGFEATDVTPEYDAVFEY